MKKITFVFLTTVLLGLFQSPAHAEVCSTGTYTVSGINTFGDLPCKDPGTEINVTVRGLHDWGVPGGPTSYCSFIYVRKNLGTAQNPNWYASTDTVCEARPAPVQVIQATPTPSPAHSVAPSPEPTITVAPTPSSSPEPTVTSSSGSQTLVTTTNTNINNVEIVSNNLGGFAIVDQNGVVYDVIVAKVSDFGNNDKVLQQEYMGCPIGCRVIWQTQADSSGNINRYISGRLTTVTYNDTEKMFYEKQNGVVITKIAAPEAVKTQNSNTTTSFESLFFNSSNSNQDNTQDANSVIITATENIQVDSSSVTNTENLYVDHKVTQDEMVTIINNGPYEIMKSRVARIARLLGDWLL